VRFAMKFTIHQASHQGRAITDIQAAIRKTQRKEPLILIALY